MSEAGLYYSDADSRGVTYEQLAQMDIGGKVPYLRLWLDNNYQLWPPIPRSGRIMPGVWIPMSGGMPFPIPAGPRPTTVALSLDTALKTFPERLTRQEIAEVIGYLTNMGAQPIEAYEKPPKYHVHLHDEAQQYRRTKLGQGIGKHSILSQANFDGLTFAQKVDHLEHWLYEHFARSEPLVRFVNRRPDPMTKRSREPTWSGQSANDGDGSLDTSEAIEYFPYVMSGEDQGQAVSELSQVSSLSPRGQFMGPAVRWDIRRGYEFNDLLVVKQAIQNPTVEPFEEFMATDDINALDLGQEANAERFLAMRRAEQVVFIIRWFQHYFVDPAKTVPLDDATGAYDFSYGGPYNAADVISEQFESLAKRGALEEAIGRISQQGVPDWAPSYHHPRRVMLREAHDLGDEVDLPPPHLDDILEQLTTGVPSNLGTAREIELRRELGLRADEFRELLEQDRNNLLNMGDNQPNRTEFKQKVEQLAKSTELIRNEVAKELPDIVAATKEISKFREALSSISRSFAEGFAKETGKQAAQATWGEKGAVFHTLWEQAAQFAKAAMSWALELFN